MILKINIKSLTLMDIELTLVHLLLKLYIIFKTFVFSVYVLVFCRSKTLDYVTHIIRLLICNIKAKLNNSRSQRKILLEWIRTKVKEKHWPTNFREDWRNGITLCALIEGIVPGSCPRFDLLNKNQGINNIKLGLSLVNKYLHIDSQLEAHEIYDCSEEAKFVYFLSRLKFETAKLVIRSVLKRKIIQVTDSSGISQRSFESLFGDEKPCFAKGMGLILAVKDRRARFNIFCKPTIKLNLMIEIVGPHNSICSEKLSVHNPKKRISTDIIASTLIAQSKMRRNTVHCITNDDRIKIPFYYEIHPNKIAISYVPLFEGSHTLSIIWQGQHIMGSPYTVNVDPANSDADDSQATSPSKFMSGLQYPMTTFAQKDSNIRIDETATVVNRKVIKQVEVFDGQEKVIDFANSGDCKQALVPINDTSQQSKPRNSIDYSCNVQIHDCDNNHINKNYDKLVINEMKNEIEVFDMENDSEFSAQTAYNTKRNSFVPIIDAKLELETVNVELNRELSVSMSNQNSRRNSYVETSDGLISVPLPSKTRRVSFEDESNRFVDEIEKNDSSPITPEMCDESNNKEIESFTEHLEVCETKNSEFCETLVSDKTSGTPDSDNSIKIDKKVLKDFTTKKWFTPVKNMIECWENKQFKNNVKSKKAVCNEYRIDYTLNSIDVKNRRKLFEKSEKNDMSDSDVENANSYIGKKLWRHFTIRDTMQFCQNTNKDDNNNDNNTYVCEQTNLDENVENNLKHTETNSEHQNLIEDDSDHPNSQIEEITSKYANQKNESSEPMCELSEQIHRTETPIEEVVNAHDFAKTPESTPDSGISFISHSLSAPNHKNLAKPRLLRKRSNSYPNLIPAEEMHKRCANDFAKNCEQSFDGSTIADGQYIDDEIPDYASLFFGQYDSLTGTDKPINFDDTNIDDNENNGNQSINQSTFDNGMFPKNCRVFGAGVYYGHVGVKNSFLVSTKHGGKSFLSVGIQGADPEYVVEITVRATGQRNYEVLYEVSEPGYYIIFVKWGDHDIADSPFICKVSY